MKQAILTAASLFLISLTATAHPSGHEGGVLETVRHLLSEPNHMLPISLGIMIALVAVCGYLFVRKNHE